MWARGQRSQGPSWSSLPWGREPRNLLPGDGETWVPRGSWLTTQPVPSHEELGGLRPAPRALQTPSRMRDGKGEGSPLDKTAG